MSKNPIVNGLGALVYIVLIALVMYFGTKNMPHKEDTFLAPVAFISLFTLSAAVMGYIFLYEPVQLYFDGKKKAGLSLFLKTVSVFGAITFIVLLLLFFGILP